MIGGCLVGIDHGSGSGEEGEQQELYWIEDEDGKETMWEVE